ncbi:hypothetical protein F0562_019041 [Nyssa sinensis]|uniref:Uncharacterized protein n=1 Tax=Nyssa sinensis TaxID=561372 RepID=A0A5J4ZDT4_9ASTE|nr:hypothetical protein F0562_019041 [Nyssa sinensis]
MADSDSFNKPRFRASDLSSPIQPNTIEEMSKGTGETYSKIDNSHTYLSGILHASSIFDDGLENPCGSDEKRMLQTWNSQYFQGESMVVAAQENYVSDQWGKHGPSIDHKPLGLPIRSLKSRVVDTDSLDSINGSGSSSSLKDSSKSSDKIRNGKTRGMDPINLEEKFKETVVLSSPIPWRSRSGRMEMREEIGIVKPHSHSRPPSVGEFEFGSLKSWSSRSSSVSSQTSSVSSSSKKSESIKPPSHSRPPSVGEFEFESLKSRSPRSSVSSQTSYLSSSPKKSEAPISPEVSTSKMEGSGKKEVF